MPRRRELTAYEWGLPKGFHHRNPPEPDATLRRTDRNGFVWTRIVRADDFLAVSDVAGLFRVNPATAWNWVRSRKIKSSRRRGVTVVRFGDVEQLATERGLYKRPSGPFMVG